MPGVDHSPSHPTTLSVVNGTAFWPLAHPNACEGSGDGSAVGTGDGYGVGSGLGTDVGAGEIVGEGDGALNTYVWSGGGR